MFFTGLVSHLIAEHSFDKLLGQVALMREIEAKMLDDAIQMSKTAKSMLGTAIRRSVQPSAGGTGISQTQIDRRTVRWYI